MNELKRLYVVGSDWESYESEYGEYTLYDDAIQIINYLNEENIKLRKALNKILFYTPSYTNQPPPWIQIAKEALEGD